MRLFVGIFFVGISIVSATEAWAQDANDQALLGEASSRSAAVATILDTPRESAADQVLAVLTLIDLGETEVAAIVWKSVPAAELDEAALAALANQFGAARLMMIARLENPAGEDADAEPGRFVGAAKFVNQCVAAAGKLARDPERLAKLIAQLNGPTAEERKAARVDLAATGIEGAKACLEALAQTEDENQRARIMLAITGLQPVANPLLVAALADGQGHFRRDVAELCGYSKVHDALPFLAAIAAGAETDTDVIGAAVAALAKLGHTIPNDAEARALLMREIRRIEKMPSQELNEEQKLWWTWNSQAAANQFASNSYDLPIYRTIAAGRLAHFLTRCGEPTSRQREIALVYHYEKMELLGVQGGDNPSEKYSSEEVSSTLAAALKRGRNAAALACIQVLSSRNDASVLASATGRPSPLATALSSGNREIRFAALETIIKMSPERSFAGASRVPKTLWEFAASAGPAQAVAASSVISRADNWAAQLREHGYDATPTYSGRAALQAALNSPRIEVVVVDSDIDMPTAREIIYQLRSHDLTAQVPVAILSSLPRLKYSQHVALTDDNLFAVIRPHNDQAVQDIVERLQKLSDQTATEEQRTSRALLAIQWIGHLIEHGHPYDELLRNTHILGQTVHTPGLVEASLKTLALAGTAESQLTLLDYASQRVHPIKDRQLAADAFAISVDRYGKQLRLAEIRRQYERYNASETADEATQKVLGQILDTLEKKHSRALSTTEATATLSP